MARRTVFQRAHTHFETHPRGRLHEKLAWIGSGAGLGLLTFFGWRADIIATVFAVILGFISVCIAGWGLLPPTPRPQAPKQHGRLRQQKRAR